jgi:hypothetical protein
MRLCGAVGAVDAALDELHGLEQVAFLFVGAPDVEERSRLWVVRMGQLERDDRRHSLRGFERERRDRRSLP